MKVYALVGKSGTGKSFQAINLCRQMNIDYIIDDGLLIGEAAILAGTSAKRQATTIGAIKTALFTKPEHRNAVRDKIAEVQPETLLILGTSDEMITRIRGNLGLPELERTIYIEEITTEEERAIADKQRHEQGKHVIPVPTFQLKREFSGYFVDALKKFRSKPVKKEAERSVVRPTYSYFGNYFISDRVITDIVEYIGGKADGVAEVTKTVIEKADEGISIRVSLIMDYGPDIMKIAEAVQREIHKKVEEMTSFNIEAVDIRIKGLRCG